jgi:subtilase family serine protease
MIYDILVGDLPRGWKVSLSNREIELDGGGEKRISIRARSTFEVEPDGFAEIIVTAIPRDKPSKKTSISLLATVKGAYLKLGITNVFHWPSVFKHGEVVTSRFSVRNDGNVTARNLSIVLSVNGIEKNRVEDISIPPGGYADVKMPWRALQGKNSICISVLA